MGVYRVQLQRNLRDNRDASFQLTGDRSIGAHERINEQFEQVRPELSRGARSHLLSRYVVSSIQEANRQRLSLAIIHPHDIELRFDANDARSAQTPELTLFDAEDEQESGAKRFALMPGLAFRDEGGQHNLTRVGPI
jgi:hypothetical protein